MDTAAKKGHAFVTGGTSGIGLGISQQLLDLGYRVSVNGLLPDGGEASFFELFRSIEKGLVRFASADLRVPAQILAMLDQAKADFGPISVLVNCAGIQHVSPVEEFPFELWDDIIAVNLSSAFHTIRSVFPEMKLSGWGRIINIASAHSLVASPYKAAYVAAKHGILGLTKTVALEGAKFGVTCVAICPGYVMTPLVEKQIPDTAKARGMTEQEVVEQVLLSAQPTGAFVTVEQIAETVAFLLTSAANNITGSSISLDGGWTAQ